MGALDIFNRYRIGVLAGGISSEREISLKSGEAVFRALSGLGLDAVLIDAEKRSFLDQLKGLGVNLVFIALHGKFGEDGEVQRILESANIPYTGSGPGPSSLAMDKFSSKKKFEEAGLRVPACALISNSFDTDPGESDSFSDDPIKVVVKAGLSAPFVVKPRREGSSMGLSVVMSDDRLEEAVAAARVFGEDVLIEEFVPGREITVGVLSGKALPVVEVVPREGVYDFTSKYISPCTVYEVPAGLAPETLTKAENCGLTAHNALGCGSFSRVDMRMSGSGELFILEVNTVPGLTEKSLLPMAALADGVDFSELCVKMLASALAV